MPPCSFARVSLIRIAGYKVGGLLENHEEWIVVEWKRDQEPRITLPPGWKIVQ